MGHSLSAAGQKCVKRFRLISQAQEKAPRREQRGMLTFDLTCGIKADSRHTIVHTMGNGHLSSRSYGYCLAAHVSSGLSTRFFTHSTVEMTLHLKSQRAVYSPLAFGLFTYPYRTCLSADRCALGAMVQRKQTLPTHPSGNRQSPHPDVHRTET